ncbi:MAG: hypothetical protein HY828_15900 [Actinobacteria bacterium]|nr:hypothetical protein [Actinomycetota bacterium]
MSEQPDPHVAPTRRCWRCLQQFPLDPTLPGGHPTEWWVCETCHAALLPDRP